MAKQAKLPQTDWTRGGKQISDAAIPQYTASINRTGDYLADPSKYTQNYLDQYYGGNAIQNQDFLRAYNRASNQMTGANYAATGGGYTSSGQRAYDDMQRYYNDLASRLQQYGVNSARSMYDRDVANELNAMSAFNNAYGLGKNYSAIETQNNLTDQANKNWWSNALQAGGSALSAIPNPWTQAIGAGMTMAGGMTAKDFGSANAGYASIYGGQGAGVQNNNTFTNLYDALNATGAAQAGQNWLGNLFNKRGVAAQNAKTGLNIRP